jgi:hypothetical protein
MGTKQHRLKDGRTISYMEFGRHISKNVPHCELHILKGEGHLFPCKYMALIFDTADAEIAKVKG